MLGDEATVAGFLARDDLRDHHRDARRNALMGRRAARFGNHEVARKHEVRNPVRPTEHFGPTRHGLLYRGLKVRILTNGHDELQTQRGKRGGQFDRITLTGVEHQQDARARFAGDGRGSWRQAGGHGKTER